MRRSILLFTASFLFLLDPSLVSAAEPHASNAESHEETETSKLNTEDAAPVEAGKWELEFAYDFSNSKHRFSDEARRKERGRLREHAFDWKAAAGVLPGVELNAAIGYQDIYDKDHEGSLYGHGWTDVELGSKIRILENQEREWMLSYVPSFTLPSGPDSTAERFGVSEDFVNFTQRAVFSQTWNKWNFDLDSGYALPYGGNRRGYRGT